jgi:hypothetical protein
MNDLPVAKRGRPRLATEQQVAVIVAWHDAYREWWAQRPPKTLWRLAEDLDLSVGVVTGVIRRHKASKR